MARILLVEPDTVLARTVAEYLSPVHEVLWARDGHGAIDLLDKSECDLIITEHMFAGHNSFEFLYELRSYPEWQETPVVLFSKSFVSDSVLKSDTWQVLGRVQYLYKPSTSLALLASTLNRLAPQLA